MQMHVGVQRGRANNKKDRAFREKGQKGKEQQYHGSTTDPDSKISTKPGRPFQLNYLGQVSVDTESHVITHIETFTADKRDIQCPKDTEYLAKAYYRVTSIGVS